jgi:hypothetical protein
MQLTLRKEQAQMSYSSDRSMRSALAMNMARLRTSIYTTLVYTEVNMPLPSLN